MGKESVFEARDTILMVGIGIGLLVLGYMIGNVFPLPKRSTPIAVSVPASKQATLVKPASVPAAISKGKVTEEKAARAIKAIGAAWTKAVDEQRPIIVWGKPDCLSAMTLVSSMQVEFDVKKTDKVLEPYVGYVELRGIVQRFDSKWQCYNTPEDAIKALNQDPGREWVSDKHPIVAHYKITDREITLSSYNKWMETTLIQWLERKDNLLTWQDVLAQPID